MQSKVKNVRLPQKKSRITKETALKKKILSG